MISGLDLRSKIRDDGGENGPGVVLPLLSLQCAHSLQTEHALLGDHQQTASRSADCARVPPSNTHRFLRFLIKTRRLIPFVFIPYELREKIRTDKSGKMSDETIKQKRCP